MAFGIKYGIINKIPRYLIPVPRYRAATPRGQKTGINYFKYVFFFLFFGDKIIILLTGG